MAEPCDDPGSGVTSAPMWTRRDVLVRGAQVTAGATALAAFLAACGGSEATTGTGAGTTAAAETTTSSAATETTTSSAATATAASGLLRLLTYPGPWIGKSTAADFFLEHEIPLDISEYPGAGDQTDMVNAVTADPGAYDLVWLSGRGLRGLAEAGLVADVDPARIPNLGLVLEPFRTALPGAAPNGWGSCGIVYRGDLVPERPASWADLWELAQTTYSERLSVVDNYYVLAAAMLEAGVVLADADQAQLDAARDSVIALKPHMVGGRIAPATAAPLADLIDGTAALGIAFDYEAGFTQFDNPDLDLVWVAPEDGLPAYVEGLAVLQGSDRQADAELFIDFLLDPPNYAVFINTVATGWVMPEVASLLDVSFLGSPLDLNQEAVTRAQFWSSDMSVEQADAADAAWAEVQSA